MLRNGFKALNAVQFIDAVNENLFKMLATFFLIHLAGEQFTASITTVVGGLFVLPFVVLSTLGGVFGDRWSKTSVIRITRMFQLAVTFAMIFAVFWQVQTLTYILLVLMATSASLFGPSKYGMIGELVGAKDMMKANGYISACTLFGIIFGTFLASLLNGLFDSHFTGMFALCFALTLLGTYFSFKIPVIAAANPDKKQRLFIYSELYQTFRDMRQKRFMLLSIFAYGGFFFLGAFVQLNIITFSVEILHMDPNVGGYLFLFGGVGMGIGSWIAAKMGRNLKILAPFAVLSALGCFLLVAFPFPYWLNALWLAFLGVSAGIFVVPTQAFLVEKSEPEDRARNFGTANFLSFILALLAALLLYLFSEVFHLNASQNFNILGWLSLAMALFLYWHTRNGKSGSAASNNR